MSCLRLHVFKQKPPEDKMQWQLQVCQCLLEDVDGKRLCFASQDPFSFLSGSVSKVPLEMHLSSSLSCGVRVSGAPRVYASKPNPPLAIRTGSGMGR